MEVKTYKDEDLKYIINALGCIQKYARILRGEDPKYSDPNEIRYKSHQKAVETYSESLEFNLDKIGETFESLKTNLVLPILEKTDYFFDFHPLALHKKGMEKFKELFYLGRVREKEIRTINNNTHIFLRTASNEQGSYGISYPPIFQPYESEVYTHNGITWIDYSDPIVYVNDEEHEILRRARREIPRTLPKPIFKDSDNQTLEDLIQKGKRNYANLVNPKVVFLEKFLDQDEERPYRLKTGSN